jgi:hypothetical protein
MGLILDSSVVIAAEREKETVQSLIERIVRQTGDQEAALSAIGLTELIHGIYRAQTPEIRVRRESILLEWCRFLRYIPSQKRPPLLPVSSTANSAIVASLSPSETCSSVQPLYL